MIIVKIGGGEKINVRGILKGIEKLGDKTIIVHGANFEMKNLTEALGLQEKFITSPSGHISRYSDKKVMEVFTAAYCGLVNKRIVSEAIGMGIPAVGLSGIDGSLWLARRKEKILQKTDDGKTKVINDNFHGKVEKVNDKLMEALIKGDFVPIISAPAVTEKGEIVNIDNDTAIAVMVRDLKVKKIISFLEAPGILSDSSDENSLIDEITVLELEEKIDKFSGRMKKKILGIIESFKNGLEEMIVADGRVENPVERTLAGEGTLIKK